MRPVLLTALAVSGAATLAAQQRAISDSDLFAFRWVASPQISPDGRQAAYVLVTVNAKHDGYETSVWLVATDGASPPRRLTAGPKDGGPRWSPHGTTLAFLRSKDGPPQLHLLPLAGREAPQLTHPPHGAATARASISSRTAWPSRTITLPTTTSIRFRRLAARSTRWWTSTARYSGRRRRPTARRSRSAAGSTRERPAPTISPTCSCGGTVAPRTSRSTTTSTWAAACWATKRRHAVARARAPISGWQ